MNKINLENPFNIYGEYPMIPLSPILNVQEFKNRNPNHFTIELKSYPQNPG